MNPVVIVDIVLAALTRSFVGPCRNGNKQPKAEERHETDLDAFPLQRDTSKAQGTSGGVGRIPKARKSFCDKKIVIGSPVVPAVVQQLFPGKCNPIISVY